MLFSFPSSYWEIEITHHYSLIVFLFSSCAEGYYSLPSTASLFQEQPASFYLSESTASMYVCLTQRDALDENTALQVAK